jgi:chromosome segregation ATPase
MARVTIASLKARLAEVEEAYALAVEQLVKEGEEERAAAEALLEARASAARFQADCDSLKAGNDQLVASLRRVEGRVLGLEREKASLIQMSEITSKARITEQTELRELRSAVATLRYEAKEAHERADLYEHAAHAAQVVADTVARSIADLVGHADGRAKELGQEAPF